MKKHVFRVLALLLTLTIIILGAELISRTPINKSLPRIKLMTKMHEKKTAIYVQDDILGWKIKPNLVNASDYMHPCVNTDKNGYRIISYTPTSPTGILVGDSFAFGSEVYDNETLGYYLSQDLGINILNAGVPGYGFDQIYLALESKLKNNDFDFVLISIILDDIKRMSYKTYLWMPKPFFTLKANTLVYHAPENAKTFYLNKLLYKHSVLFQTLCPNYVNQMFYAQNTTNINSIKNITNKLLSQLGQLHKKYNIPFILIIQPDHSKLYNASKQQSLEIATYALKNNLRVINLYDNYEIWQDSNLWAAQ